MKAHIYFHILVAGLLLLNACSYNEDKYFTAPIQIIEDVPNIHRLTGEKVVLTGGLTYRQFAVYDSLIFFWHDELPDHKSFSIFNFRTKKHIGNFVSRGRGPHESNVAPIYQLFEEDGNIKTILNAPNEEEIRVWNITESIVANTTIYDTILPLKWRRKYQNSYLNIFYRSADKISLAYLPGKQELKPLPSFERISYETDTLVCTYDIYREYPESDLDDNNWLYSNNCISPDGNKIAMCMHYLCQVNILNVDAQTTSFYRVKGSVDSRIFQKEYHKIPNSFFQAQCDENNIYGLYLGKPALDKDNKPILPNLIYVFDWNGNMTQKLELEVSATQIWLDSNNTLLYTYNELNEDLYRYDLSGIEN